MCFQKCHTLFRCICVNSTQNWYTRIVKKKKKKNLHAARFAGNIKTCAYDISQKLHFDDLWKKLSPTLKGLVIKYCYLLNKSACWKHLYFQIQISIEINVTLNINKRSKDAINKDYLWWADFSKVFLKC